MVLDTLEIPNAADVNGYPALARIMATHIHDDVAAHGGTYIESGGQVTPAVAGGYKLDIAGALCRVGPSTSRNEFLFRFAGSTATTIAVAADATNPKWVLVELEAGQVVDFTGGTAAASPLMPDLTAGRVPIAALYVPANATSCEAWQGAADGKVQIISLRVVRKQVRQSDILGARYGVVAA